MSGRACHTVLSYCEEGEGEGQGQGQGEGQGEGEGEMDTQPLSMFSGERGRGMEEESRDLDDLFLNLDDPFSGPADTQSSSCSKLDDTLTKLDDPIAKLDDPFSISPDTSPRSECSKQADLISELDGSPYGDSPTTGGEEQLVPASPPPTLPREGVWPEGEGAESGSEEEDQVPRRQYRRALSHCGRQYNLHLLPKQFQKTSSMCRAGRQRSRVNWASRVSILNEREWAGPAGVGGARKGLGVFEVPLSAGEEGGRREEVWSRENLSSSRLDLSHSSRTREKQV